MWLTLAVPGLFLWVPLLGITIAGESVPFLNILVAVESQMAWKEFDFSEKVNLDCSDLPSTPPVLGMVRFTDT